MLDHSTQELDHFNSHQTGSEGSSQTMTDCYVNYDREIRQGLFNGLGHAIIASALQQEQVTSQAQLQQLMQAQAKLRWQNRQLLEVIQQQQ